MHSHVVNGRYRSSRGYKLANIARRVQSAERLGGGKNARAKEIPECHPSSDKGHRLTRCAEDIMHGPTLNCSRHTTTEVHNKTCRHCPPNAVIHLFGFGD